jgi:molybdopterin-guanine dinucleotide biosynthesis protein A
MASDGLTGVLLVGGASRRFGSPKALVHFEGQTLAERAWRLLGDVCEERIAVGKVSDALRLPFSIVDDDTPIRAPLAGVITGMRAASNDVCVVVPVDCPLLSARSLSRLAAGVGGAAAAVAQTGPLPGAYRRRALPALERSLAAGEYALRDALRALEVRVVVLDAWELANVNTPADLRALSRRTACL